MLLPPPCGAWMQRHSRSGWLVVFAMAGILMTSLVPLTLQAEPFTWNSDNTLLNPQNGPGTWSSDPSNLSWVSMINDPLSWVNAAESTAVFGPAAASTNPGVGGLIQLAENITLNRLELGTAAGAYTFQSASTGSYGFHFDGIDPSINTASSSDLVLNVPISSSSTLAKEGAGHLVFNSPITSLPGGLQIRQGAVSFRAENVVPVTANVTIGSATFAGTLNVQKDQTIGSLNFSSRTAATTNQVNITNGSTLTVNGSLINGIVDGTSTGNTTNTTISGNGTLVINTTTGNLVVASGNEVASATSAQRLDLSGLKHFNSTTNNIYIGRVTTTTGSFASSGRSQATMILAENNQITAKNLLLGVNSQNTTSNHLQLGLNNSLNLDNMVIGGGRSSGNIRFNSALTNSHLTLRGHDGGNSRSNIYLADSRNTTGFTTAGGSSHPIGTLDFTGGTVDLLVNTLNVGIGGTDNGNYLGGAYGRATGHFTFGGANSIVDVNHLQIGVAANTNAVAENTSDPYVTTYGNFTMNGGKLIVNNSMVIGLSQDGEAGNQQSIQSTFTMNDGQAEIHADIVLGQHESTGTGNITAVINLIGGKLTAHGDMVRGDALTSGTIHFDGGHLDLMGGNIGDATLPVTMNINRGEISNLGEFNGGADFIKNTAGTFVLSGINSYTGTTIINNGNLLARTTTALQNTANIVIENGGTFSFDDQAGGTLELPTSSGVALELKDGSSIGAQLGNTTGSIVVKNGATVLTDSNASILVNIHHTNGGTAPASSILLKADSGGITSNGATYEVGVVYNNTNFTVALDVTDTQIAVDTTDAGPINSAYWTGSFHLDNDTWSATNGSNASNWSITPDGTGNTGIAPGATTDVYFSASPSSLAVLTDLGANMTIKSLTVDTANPLTLDDAAHSLTIVGSDAVTINSTAAAVKFHTNLLLMDAAAVFHVNNSGGFHFSGTLTAHDTQTITKTGTGTWFLDSIQAMHRARTIINEGTLAITAEEALGDNPLSSSANHLTLNGGTLRALETFTIDDSNRGITIGSNGGTFEVDVNRTLTIENAITSSGHLTKTGDGTLVLAAPVSGTNTNTIIKGGTLSLDGGDNTLPNNRTLTFEAFQATLDLNQTTQSFSNLIFNSPTGSGPVNLFIKGDGGTLINNNNSSITRIVTNNSNKPLFLDMSGLSNFIHNGATQTFDVGLITNTSSPQGQVPVSTVRLAENNTITANILSLGSHTSSSGGGLNTLILGQTNTFNVNNINIAAGRSSGMMRFDQALENSTLKVRGTDGTSALGTWNMGKINNFSNTTWYSTADFTGGSIDVLVTNLNVGSVDNRQGTIHATFIMDKGSLTATNLVIGNAQGTDVANPGTRTANSIFNLIGDGTVNVTNMIIGRNTANVADASSDPNAHGTLNISSGTVNVGAGGIVMGQATVAGYDASATINLTGGVLNVSGDIAKSTSGSGNVVSTIQLRGGTLNLNHKNIGSASRKIDHLIFISGTLQNVSEINGGGDIAKTGSSHEVLILSGTNTHTGATTIQSGKYLVHGSHTGGNDYTIQSGATLGGHGNIVLAANAGYTLDPNAILMVGDGVGAAQQFSLTSSGSGALTFSDSTSLLSTRLLLDPGSGGTDHSLDLTTADLLTVSGDVYLNGATLYLEDANALAAGFAIGDTWRLFDWSGVTTSGFGTGSNTFSSYILPTLSSGLMWDTSNLYTTGTITVAVPEPTQSVLILSGVMIALMMRRRRR